MSKKLKFSDLEAGDKFIAFPVHGDDLGHGGYKGGHVMYIKWKGTSIYGWADVPDGEEALPTTAKRYSNNTFTMLPDLLEVIKIV